MVCPKCLGEIFKGFFRPKLGDFQKKKKKRSSPKFRAIFHPISQVQTFEGGLFSYGGGLFSIFHRKSASKAQKTCFFAYFTSQWGGLEPPRPPLATLLLTVILYDPRTASANKNSSMGVMLNNISRAPVEVPGKADEIIKQASLHLCEFPH